MKKKLLWNTGVVLCLRSVVLAGCEDEREREWDEDVKAGMLLTDAKSNEIDSLDMRFNGSGRFRIVNIGKKDTLEWCISGASEEWIVGFSRQNGALIPGIPVR